MRLKQDSVCLKTLSKYLRQWAYPNVIQIMRTIKPTITTAILIIAAMMILLLIIILTLIIIMMIITCA